MDLGGEGRAMTFSQLGMYALRVRLALMRFGLGKGVACLFFFTGVAVWLWWIPALHEQQKVAQQNWLSAKQTQQSIDVSKPNDPQAISELNFNHFTRVLGSPLDTEKQVNTLFELAKNTGLTLSKAEYKLAEDKNGRYRSYQILLPVKGSYNSIRQFCEKILLAIPFASLDEMGFKRESIASVTLEARLRFTLYLSESNTDSMNKEKNKLSLPKEAP
jgi:hypothetical protein